MYYVGWAIVALVAYSVLPPLVSIATQEIPDTVVALVANVVLVVAALGVTMYEGERIVPYLTSENAPAMYLAGVALAVGILAYYHALSIGPISVVVRYSACSSPRVRFWESSFWTNRSRPGRSPESRLHWFPST